jgi:hypothetical protein
MQARGLRLEAGKINGQNLSDTFFKNGVQVANGTYSFLKTTSQTLVTIRFQGTSGKKIYINWGDGTETSHTLNGAVNVDAMHTYSVAGLKSIKIFGDLNEVTVVSQLGNPLVFGDITDFLDPFSALVEVHMLIHHHLQVT